jgi:hypothetical protein
MYSRRIDRCSVAIHNDMKQIKEAGDAMTNREE